MLDTTLVTPPRPAPAPTQKLLAAVARRFPELTRVQDGQGPTARLMARMDGHFAAAEQSPAHLDDWKALKRRAIGMLDGLPCGNDAARILARLVAGA